MHQFFSFRFLSRLAVICAGIDHVLRKFVSLRRNRTVSLSYSYGSMPEHMTFRKVTLAFYWLAVTKFPEINRLLVHIIAELSKLVVL
ncbi:MAG: hypothetical protein ABJN11_08510 [Lentilitoribacter sp.]